METINQFFLCECNGEAMLFTKYNDETDKEIYVSIYVAGQFNPKPTFVEKLKYCWYHLKTGKKFEDNIILSFDKAQEIAKWLTENAK